VVCGWEANGGFLLGSDVLQDGRALAALPTRDAILPILGVLYSALEKRVSLAELFGALPPRFSRAALLRNFPRANGRRLVKILGAGTPGEEIGICRRLEGFFQEADGFSPIGRIDYTDGVRILFVNGEVAHFRPSGNADEFRIYAVADTQKRANQIVAMGVAEPDGIIRRLERDLLS
jgi:phosphomannomutase